MPQTRQASDPSADARLLTGPVRDAFDRAALRSELYRSGGLAVAFVAITVIIFVRRWLAGDQIGHSTQVAMLVLVACAFAYELGVYFLIRRALSRASRLPRWFWFSNVVIECSIPSIAIVILWRTHTLAPSQAVVAPAILGYCMFIILSVLRMRPGVCVFSGVICGLSHLALVLALGNAHGDPSQVVIPRAFLFTYPIVLILCGFMAGFVTSRVRAHVVAALLEASRRQTIEQELQAARIIQRGLLPDEPPTIPGFTIAGWNQSADETGGDYYDWQALADGRVAIMLADVTGHGLGPALITAFCRAYARAILQRDEALPSALTALNVLISDDLPEARFITFVAAILDPKSATVPLLSAGHGPILHYRKQTGVVEDHAAHGVPLGVVPDFEFEQVPPFELAQGDVLVLLTDGFFEWPDSSGEMYGIARLKESIARHADEAPEALIERIHGDVVNFVGDQPQPDDLTAVVVRRTAT